MRGFIVSAGALVLGSGALLAQAADSNITFDVASVRSSPHASSADQLFGGGPGTTNPGRVTCTSCSLQVLLVNAYGVKPERITGPPWLRTELFDIVAKVEAGATPEQVPVMLQNLLIERFKLALHREPKETDGYALVVAKNGPAAKLKQRAGASNDKDGFPKIPAGAYQAYIVKPDKSAARLAARQATMAQIARLFGSAASGIDVVDKTGLTGIYDVTLYFNPGGTIEDPTGTFRATLERELGLRLEKAKVQTDLLIIDHIEKAPTEN
jgi:uncharacterized protein (TIGR03435 family)